MSVIIPSGFDQLLSSVIKLESKLLALQNANTASLSTKAYESPLSSSKSELVLGHTVSSISTDCPDVVSTEEEDTEMRADDSESSSDDDE